MSKSPITDKINAAKAQLAAKTKQAENKEVVKKEPAAEKSEPPPTPDADVEISVDKPTTSTRR